MKVSLIKKTKWWLWYLTWCINRRTCSFIHLTESKLGFIFQIDELHRHENMKQQLAQFFLNIYEDTGHWIPKWPTFYFCLEYCVMTFKHTSWITQCFQANEVISCLNFSFSPQSRFDNKLCWLQLYSRNITENQPKEQFIRSCKGNLCCSYCRVLTLISHGK